MVAFIFRFSCGSVDHFVLTVTTQKVNVGGYIL